MKIEFELTEKDLDTIAQKVVEKQADKAFMESVYKASEDAARHKFWPAFEEFQAKMEISSLLDEHLTHLIEKHLITSDVIKQGVLSMINSRDIKRLGADLLRQKANQLEQEAEEA